MISASFIVPGGSYSILNTQVVHQGLACNSYTFTDFNYF